MIKQFLNRKISYRYDFKTELALAIMPAIVVISVLALLQVFSKQQLLFASLASSVFLIYLDPKHSTNSIRTLLIAQLSASIISYIIYLIIGQGYVGAAILMIITIVIMILANAVHPPAVSTALIFAFRHQSIGVLMMFFLAILLVVILIILQRSSLWAD